MQAFRKKNFSKGEREKTERREEERCVRRASEQKRPHERARAWTRRDEQRKRRGREGGMGGEGGNGREGAKRREADETERCPFHADGSP